MTTYKSFHGLIALPLEEDIKTFSQNDNLKIQITADIIENGCFIPVMILIIVHRYGYESKSLEFLNYVYEYVNVDLMDIPFEKKSDIYQLFKTLMECDD